MVIGKEVRYWWIIFTLTNPNRQSFFTNLNPISYPVGLPKHNPSTC
jgi:hypothetical protein